MLPLRGFFLRRDVFLQRCTPSRVVDFGHIVAVVLECGEVFVEAETGVAGHLGDAEGRLRRAEGRGDDDAGDVVDGDCVDCVGDVGAAGELEAAFEHADEEVVGVGYCDG